MEQPGNPKVVGSNPAPATNILTSILLVFLYLKFNNSKVVGSLFINIRAPATNI